MLTKTINGDKSPLPKLSTPFFIFLFLLPPRDPLELRDDIAQRNHKRKGKLVAFVPKFWCSAVVNFSSFASTMNRQGKTRLAKYYVPLEDSEKHKVEYEVHRLVVNRDPKFTNFVEVYLILDEFILAGELQETSKKAIIERMGELEKLE
ncbi:hypothetical protein DVH24_012996 [Malus domestica]|uniref:AP complex mu/sigma subunit domain-containing protein n=1 Tax=Malus domestica TaxID=3750 RepID=A0A498HTL6_MALDO|nr:hypothetical protein DVH24_012996 [Malus domestica]